MPSTNTIWLDSTGLPLTPTVLDSGLSYESNFTILENDSTYPVAVSGYGFSSATAVGASTGWVPYISSSQQLTFTRSLRNPALLNVVSAYEAGTFYSKTNAMFVVPCLSTDPGAFFSVTNGIWVRQAELRPTSVRIKLQIDSRPIAGSPFEGNTNYIKTGTYNFTFGLLPEL
jgi:hypothetical protein